METLMETFMERFLGFMETLSEIHGNTFRVYGNIVFLKGLHTEHLLENITFLSEYHYKERAARASSQKRKQRMRIFTRSLIT